MPTTNLGLPLITGNMTADVVRDMNALAEAVDAKVASKTVVDGAATKAEVKTVGDNLTTHLADNVKHITELEREIWNSSGYIEVANIDLSQMTPATSVVINNLNLYEDLEIELREIKATYTGETGHMVLINNLSTSAYEGFFITGTSISAQTGRILDVPRSLGFSATIKIKADGKKAVLTEVSSMLLQSNGSYSSYRKSYNMLKSEKIVHSLNIFPEFIAALYSSGKIIVRGRLR